MDYLLGWSLSIFLFEQSWLARRHSLSVLSSTVEARWHALLTPSFGSSLLGSFVRSFDLSGPRWHIPVLTLFWVLLSLELLLRLQLPSHTLFWLFYSNRSWRGTLAESASVSLGLFLRGWFPLSYLGARVGMLTPFLWLFFFFSAVGLVSSTQGCWHVGMPISLF